MDFEKFFKLVPNEIKNCVKRLNSEILAFSSVSSPYLAEIVNYVLKVSGKRVRPIFLFLTYMLRGNISIPEKVFKMAMVIELMHSSTLVHDDIIDSAEVRRGQPSANKKFGNSQALLCGDYLLTKAFGLCSKLPFYVRSATEETAVRLIEGEMNELYIDLNSTLEEILEIAHLKTASLFGLCGECASFMNGDEPHLIDLTKDFGCLCGQAFQALDDIFDIIGDQNKTGKAVGTDLRERKLTVPIFFWIKSGSSLALDYINDFSPEKIPVYIKDIVKSGSLHKSVDLLKDFIDKARVKALCINKNPQIYEVFEAFFSSFLEQPEFRSLEISPP
ncbi:MAG: polyprenyl synthetase family protein [Deltaproteobacteria bacterium]|nr:polyprenyl synthetase family protein [Deltaproteobacteria bacterium]MCX7952455.1 polyprenyl synthetase family protein [Deltaproteobacteria bacterium]